MDVSGVLFAGDGVFDQLSSKDVTDCVWMTMEEHIKAKTIHAQSAIGVDMILKTSLVRKTLDNITCVLLAFENFEKQLNSSKYKEYRSVNKSKVEYTKESIEKLDSECLKGVMPMSTKNETSNTPLMKVDFSQSLDSRAQQIKR